MTIHKVIFLVFIMLIIVYSLSNAKGNPPAGKISTIKGSVSIERNDEKYSANKGMEIFCNDAIKTEKGGSASVSFGSDSALVLNQNSMLGVELKNEMLVYTLIYGQIRGILKDLPRKIILKAGDVIVTASDAEFDVYIEENKDNHFYLLKGRAWWYNEKWEIKKLLSENGLVIWNEGGIPSLDESRKKQANEKVLWYDVLQQESAK